MNTEKKAYAVVEIGGAQYPVEDGGKILVNGLSLEPGEKLAVDKVLLVNNKELKVGSPHVDGASVEFEAGANKKTRGVSFRKNRRKGFKKKIGFRQTQTELLVKSIKA